jgi:hypothetical protein
MALQPPIWRKGNNPKTGWEVLSIPASGTFTRDWQDNYYYLHGVSPTTWKQIADVDDVAKLKRAFGHAFGY